MERLSEYTIYHSGNIQALRYTVQKVTPGADAPHPISPEMLRIVRIVSGACTWVISRHEYRVGAGDIVILNNTEKRYQTGISPDAPVVQEVVRFMPVAFSDISKYFPLFFYRGSGFSHVFSPGCPDYRRLDGIMTLLRDEEASAAVGKDTAMLSLVRVLIIGLYRSAVAMGRLPADIGNEKKPPERGELSGDMGSSSQYKGASQRGHLGGVSRRRCRHEPLSLFAPFRRGNGNDDPAVYPPFATAHGSRAYGIAEPRHS